MVWDWRVSRVGPLHFYWPSCSLPFCLLLISFSLPSFYGLVLWGPALLCQTFLLIIIMTINVSIYISYHSVGSSSVKGSSAWPSCGSPSVGGDLCRSRCWTPRHSSPRNRSSSTSRTTCTSCCNSQTLAEMTEIISIRDVSPTRYRGNKYNCISLLTIND